MGKNKKAENGANMDGETWFGMKLEEFDKDVLELAYGQMAGLTKRLYDAMRKEGFSKSDAQHYVDTVIFAAMGAAQDHRDLR